VSYIKSKGIKRNIDELGRIVIPVPLRKKLNIKVDDPIEILVDDDGVIILRKYNPGCVICESKDIAIEIKGKRLCKDCLEYLNKLEATK
jgi:AbrB family transcriptional regulator, transcriptional pleiotropic regulator of transition state genes